MCPKKFGTSVVPPKCSICIHPQRPEIDRLLLSDDAASYRDIARRYNVSKDAVARHREAHLSKQMARVAKRNQDADVRQAIDIRTQLFEINDATRAILSEARESGNGALALAAIDRVQRQIETQAKLIDLISDAPTINIHLAPEWVAVRTTIVAALEAYPEAAQNVATALQGIEGGRNHDRIA